MQQFILHILFVLCSFSLVAQNDASLEEILENLNNLMEESEESEVIQDDYDAGDYENEQAQEKYLKTPIEKKRFNRDKWNDIRQQAIEEAMGEGGSYQQGESPYEGRQYSRRDNPYEQNQKNYERYWSERKKNTQEIKRRPKEQAPRNRNRNSALDKVGDMRMSPVVAYIIIGLIIAALVGLIFYLFFKAPPANNKVIPKDLNEDFNPTEIPKSELELALDKAIEAGDYRRAVRIYFIFIIRALTEQNLIAWEKEKTNSTYLYEMRKNQHYHSFDESVMLYEIVWYGKRKVDKETYRKLEPTFKSLIQKLEN